MQRKITQPEFAKSLGAKALFGCFVTLPETKIIIFLGKNGQSLMVKACPKALFNGAPDTVANCLGDFRAPSVPPAVRITV